MIKTPENLHISVEIHPIDTNRRVIFDSQINMFTDAKPELARIAKISFLQLILFDFQTSFENLLGFGSSDGDMDCNLFVAADPKCADRVPSFTYNEIIRFAFSRL